MNKIVRHIISQLFILYILGMAAASSEKSPEHPSGQDNRLQKGDRFQEIKAELDSAAMVSFDVLTIVESEIFDEIDSTAGKISIARDGRYVARLNDDIYLFDGECVWEFSSENNQATKRCLGEGEEVENRLGFIKKLDDYYKTSVIKENSIYRLIKKGEDDGSLPDSMLIYLKESKLARIEYLDLNNDLNKVWILKETISDSLPEEVFEINLPDSAEVITLP